MTLAVSPGTQGSQVRSTSASRTTTPRGTRNLIRPLDDQRYFIFLNHPIKWVRIAGIVVAVDEYPGRRVYTVDDSSGLCIECLIDIPRPPPPAAAASTMLTEVVTTPATTAADPGTSKVPDGVDVGTVVDIKGELALFRDHKQIKILKTSILRSTEHEVVFWEKLRDFRQSVLDKPWVLTDKQVRRCRKDEERRR